MTDLIIRKETSDNYSRTWEIIKKAFKKAAFSNQNKHVLVRKIRNSDAFFPEFSLISKLYGNALGHILLNKVKHMEIYSNLKKLIRYLDRFNPYPIFYSFEMTDSEVEIFEKYVIAAKLYLEFGMGGSTLHALKISNTSIHSIDSSQDWVNLMASYSLVKLNSDRIQLHYVNIGEVKDWGHPVSDKQKHLFPNYSSEIFYKIKTSDIDLILVDGRFRVACILQTILSCHKNKNLTIMAHDFWNREKYHVVLKYLNVIDKADKLGVFTIKEGIDLQEVQSHYDHYKFVSD